MRYGPGLSVGALSCLSCFCAAGHLPKAAMQQIASMQASRDLDHILEPVIPGDKATCISLGLSSQRWRFEAGTRRVMSKLCSGRLSRWTAVCIRGDSEKGVSASHHVRVVMIVAGLLTADLIMSTTSILETAPAMTTPRVEMSATAVALTMVLEILVVIIIIHLSSSSSSSPLPSSSPSPSSLILIVIVFVIHHHPHNHHPAS